MENLDHLRNDPPNAAPGMTRQRTPVHIASLDGLRGVAVSLVVLFHFFEQVVPFGWCGVDLFFVLSGFLITGILWDTKGYPGYYPRFLMRRALRIMPLYFGVVGGMVLFSMLVRNGATQEILDTQLWYWTFSKNLHVAWHGWSHGWHVLDHFWSLAIEEQFYLVWPWLVMLFDLRWLMRAALFGAALSVALRIAHPIYPFAYVFTLSRLDGLLLGAWLALAERRAQRSIAVAGRPFLIGGTALVAVAALLDSSLTFYGPNMVRCGYLGFAMLFAGWLARVVAGKGSRWEERWLTGRVLVGVGRYSYGIYVYHNILYWFFLVGMDRLRGFLGGWTGPVHFAGLVALIPLTYSISALSYELYEKRFLRLKPLFAPVQRLGAADPART